MTDLNSGPQLWETTALPNTIWATTFAYIKLFKGYQKKGPNNDGDFSKFIFEFL